MEELLNKYKEACIQGKVMDGGLVGYKSVLRKELRLENITDEELDAIESSVPDVEYQDLDDLENDITEAHRLLNSITDTLIKKGLEETKLVKALKEAMFWLNEE
jgi:hypothetical protein